MKYINPVILIILFGLFTDIYAQNGDISKAATTYICSVCKEKSRKRLAVYPLTDATDEETAECSQATTLIISAIMRCEDIKVIDPNRIEKVLEEQSKGLTGVIEESTAPRVGKLIGADILFFGKYSNNTLQITLVDAETGEILGAALKKTSSSPQVEIKKETTSEKNFQNQFSNRRIRKILRTLGKRRPGVFLFITANDEETDELKSAHPRMWRRFKSQLEKSPEKQERFNRTRNRILALRSKDSMFNSRIKKAREKALLNLGRKGQ